jgi:hypothetical protein
MLRSSRAGPETFDLQERVSWSVGRNGKNSPVIEERKKLEIGENAQFRRYIAL